MGTIIAIGAGIAVLTGIGAGNWHWNCNSEGYRGDCQTA